MSRKDTLDKARVLDLLPVGVLILDADSTVVFFNSEAERGTGLSAAHVLGRSYEAVFQDEAGAAHCSLLKEIQAGGQALRRRVVCAQRDGHLLTLDLSAAPLRDEQGRLVGVVACLSDTPDQAVASPPRRHPAVSSPQPQADASAPRPSETDEIVGRSRPMQRIYATLGALAQTDASVLLTGETGTGKGLLAKAIHAESARRGARFVDVNCAALPESLLESELFGYRKGAFTGAEQDKLGLFEAAAGGTIFLDEIGDLPVQLQAKLLQALENGTFHPLGAVRPVNVDVRVISATNRDLRARVSEGRFRPDLYYRLRVLEIGLPPLRERPGDIELLAEHFLRLAAARYQRPQLTLSPATRTALRDCPFPGNVRELKHAIEHAVILAQSTVIEPDHLPDYIVAGQAALDALSTGGGTIRDRERDMLLQALQEHNFSVSATSAALNINRTTLWRKMRKYGL